jgi:phosphocarrier protein
MNDLDTQLPDNYASLASKFTAFSKLTIKNRLGLHARAAGKLVEAVQPFKSKLVMVKDNCQADLRSILSLISLGCPYNTEVVVMASGEDANEALEAVSTVIENRFGET